MAGEASKAIDKKTLWGGGYVSPFSVSYGKLMMWFFLISDALTFGGLLTALGFHRFEAVTTGWDWPSSEQVFTHFPGTHANLPLLYVAFMTFILIVSSVTMVLAVEAGHRMDKRKVLFWMGLTVLGGAIFLGSQVWEWSTYILGPDGLVGSGDGSSLSANFFLQQTEAMTDIPVWIDHEYLMSLNEAATPISDYLTLDQSKIQVLDPLGDGAVINDGYVALLGKEGPSAYSAFFFFITGFHGFHVFSGVIINLVIFINVALGTYEKRGHYEMVEKVGLYWHFIDLVWVFVFTFYYLV